MRILLLADDSVTIQRVIALTFAAEDFRVVTVSDGQQAIDRMTAQRPDVILAATTMPNVNGYDVSKYVRSQPGLSAVPVLLLTGAFESVDEARLKACGANGTLEKPFEPTIVISRVKELLGMKGEAKPTPAAGRLVTSADAVSKRPPRPPAVTSTPPARAAAPSPLAKPSPASWDELREESGLDSGTRSVEGSAHEPGREDYLDTLDAAFDTLDARLSTRPGNASAAPRNPDPPVSRSGGAADPRSPGRLPTPRSETPAANSVFEVDDQWFAQGDQARAASNAGQRQLAAEMGIHDVDLPEAELGVHAAPAKDLDFDFGLDAVGPKEAAIDVHDEMLSVVSAPRVDPSPVEIPSFEDLRDSAPAVEAPPTPVLASLAPITPSAPAPAPAAVAQLPQASAAPALPMADAFAALLAHEQGDQGVTMSEPPAPVIQAPPEITDAMLDVIADKVAERLNGNLFADHLRAAMTATVRDTVRSVVSETSEKLVRDEIARVKAQAERDTQ